MHRTGIVWGMKLWLQRGPWRCHDSNRTWLASQWIGIPCLFTWAASVLACAALQSYPLEQLCIDVGLRFGCLDQKKKGKRVSSSTSRILRPWKELYHTMCSYTLDYSLLPPFCWVKWLRGTACNVYPIPDEIFALKGRKTGSWNTKIRMQWLAS